MGYLNYLYCCSTISPQLTVSGPFVVADIQQHVAVGHSCAHQLSHNNHFMEEESVLNLFAMDSHSHRTAKTWNHVNLVILRPL